MLMPFVQVLAKNASGPNRALQLTGRLEQMTGVPAELLGGGAELAIEYPDKLRLRAPVLGEMVTICRRGDELWAHPASKLEPRLPEASEKKKRKARLEKFALPIPEKQLIFLPALFQIKDVGSETLDGESCRVLDLFLMPEAARALKAEDWAARVWARPDGKPARLSVAKKDWNIVARFERVEFSPEMPESTWHPTPEQAGDVLVLDPARYQRLLGALLK